MPIITNSPNLDKSLDDIDILFLGELCAGNSPRGFTMKLRALDEAGPARQDRFFRAAKSRAHYGLPRTWNRRFAGSIDALAWMIEQRIRFADTLRVRPVERNRDHTLVSYLGAKLSTPGKRDDRPLIEHAEVWATHQDRVLIAFEAFDFSEDRFAQLQSGLTAIDSGWKAFLLPPGYGFKNPHRARLIVVRPPARQRLWPEHTSIKGAYFDEQDIRYLCESMSDAFDI